MPAHVAEDTRALLERLEALPDDWAFVAVDRSKRAYQEGWQSRPLDKAAMAAEIQAGRAHAIGVQGGPPSGGLLFVDHDGISATAQLERLGIPLRSLPNSWAMTSGRDGRFQLIYRVPEHQWPQLRNRRFWHTGDTDPATGKPGRVLGEDGKAEMIDLRWARHYSVVAGHHPTTSGYRWLPQRGPGDLPLADAPLALIQLLAQDGPTEPAPLLAPLTAAAPHHAATLPLLDFISRDSRTLVEQGGTPGAWNDDQLALARDLFGTEAWIRAQGHRPDITARNAFALHIKAAASKASGFDERKAWRRFDGAEAFPCTPSTPEQKLLARLRYHTRTAAAALLPETSSQPRAKKSPPGPLSLETVGAKLESMVADGATQVALSAACIELARQADLSSAAVNGLLRSIQAQQIAKDLVATEREQLAASAERTAISCASLTLSTLFPPSLAQAVWLVTRYLPSDDLSSAALLLSTCAGLTKVGTSLVASRALGFQVPLNLYVSLVGRSGIKKGPLWKALHEQPLAPIQRDMARANARALDAWKADNHGKKVAERTDPPRTPRVSISETTGEALTDALATQESHGLGLMLGREELAGLFGGLNAYRSGGRGGDAEQLLESYDGSGSSSLRISADGGGRFYSRCQLSIAGTIQPSVLKRLAAEGDGSGLWARFNFLPVPERVVPLPRHETTQDGDAREAAEALIADLARRIYSLPCSRLTLSPDAWGQFCEYEERCQRDAIRASLDSHASAWGKAPGKALRFAGLLHLVHAVMGDGLVQNRQDPVGIELLMLAENMTDSLTQAALGIHEQAANGGGEGVMERLHRLSLQVGGAVGWRDLSRVLSRRARQDIDGAMAEAAADALVALGLGEKTRAGRGWSYRATGELPT